MFSKVTGTSILMEGFRFDPTDEAPVDPQPFDASSQTRTHHPDLTAHQRLVVGLQRRLNHHRYGGNPVAYCHLGSAGTLDGHISPPPAQTQASPVAIKPPVRPYSELTATDRADLPEEMQTLLAVMPVLDPDRYPELAGLEERMTALTQKTALAKDGTGPIYVVILDDSEPNAFITRSKNSNTRVLALTLGLIRRLENDDQAVAIIGHELEHLSSQMAPYIEDLMEKAQGDWEKLYLLNIQKVEEVEVDLKSLFYRVHRQGYNPTEWLKFTNRFIQDYPDGLSLSHPLMKTRRNAVEFALTGLRRIWGEKISTKPPQNDFITEDTQEFLNSPAFAASRQEIFCVSPELKAELRALLERLKSDTVTEKDSFKTYTNNHPIFDKIVVHLLEKNRRELAAFHDEAQKVDLQNRLLLFIDDYFATQLAQILGEDFSPTSARQFQVLIALQIRNLPTPSWTGQFFVVGQLAINIGECRLDLEKLQRAFSAKKHPSKDDIREYEGKRNFLLKKIAALDRQHQAHLTAFHDTPEVRWAIQQYLEWGLSGNNHAGSLIPEDLRFDGRANDILWNNLKHIGPRVLQARLENRKMKDQRSLELIRNTDDLNDLHQLLYSGAVSEKSSSETRALFLARYFSLAQSALDAETMDPELWDGIAANLGRSEYDREKNPLDSLRKRKPKEFFHNALPVFEKMAQSFSTPKQLSWLLTEFNRPDVVTFMPSHQRLRLISLAINHLRNRAREDAQSVSRHTPEESLSGSLKPRFGLFTGSRSERGTTALINIRRDEWEQIPEDTEILDLHDGRIYPIGTAGELRTQGKSPEAVSHGYSQWGMRVRLAANDLRSYLPYLGFLAHTIAQSTDPNLTQTLQRSFSDVVSDLRGVLAEQSWFNLTPAEFNTVLALRYGPQVLDAGAATVPVSQATTLLDKLASHPAWVIHPYREVIDVHRLLEWLLSEKSPGGDETKAFALVFQYRALLKFQGIRFDSPHPQQDFDRRAKLARRFLNWLSALSADFDDKKPFVALFEFSVYNSLNQSEFSIDKKDERKFHLIPFLKIELKRLERAHGYEDAVRQIVACFTSPESVHRYHKTYFPIGLTQDRSADERTFMLEQILLQHKEEHGEADFGNTMQENPVITELERLASMPLSTERRASLVAAALDYVPNVSGIARVFDSYFEALWEERDHAVAHDALMNPKIIAALTFHSNKKKLAQWQLNQRFGLDQMERELLTGTVPTPHHTAVRSVTHDVKTFIDEQFPKNSTLKDAVIDYAEDKMLTTAAENDVLRPSRLDLNNWYKAAELSLVDLPAGLSYYMESNFDRLEMIAYLVGRQTTLPRFAMQLGNDETLINFKRAFTETNSYARAALLQSYLDENDGIFSDPSAIEELEELILGDYNHEPTFKAIYHAYLTAAPREEVKVLLASLLSTFVDAPPGTRGASLKEILNSMGPFGWKAGQFMRTSGIVGHKLAEELDSLFDRAAPPSRKKIVDDLRLVFGDTLDRVHGIRELKGSGSINYVVVVDLIAPDDSIVRAAVQIKRDNVEGLVHNENDIWEKAIGQLRRNSDTTVQRYAGIVDEARRHSMSTLSAGGDELDLSVQVSKYAAADAAYTHERTDFSGRRIYAGRPITWALDLVPDELRDKFAVYEYIDFVPLLEIPEEERIPIVTDIIIAELKAIRERETFDPDGHRGNWLVARNGTDLVRIDYAQLRRVPLEERLSFLAVFNQLVTMPGGFGPDLIAGLSQMLPELFDNLPAGVPIEQILTTALSAPDAPDKPHERLFYLRDQISDYIQNQMGDPTYLLQFTDGARSVLTSIAKISGYRAYIPEMSFQMAMAQGLGLF